MSKGTLISLPSKDIGFHKTRRACVAINYHNSRSRWREKEANWSLSHAITELVSQTFSRFEDQLQLLSLVGYVISTPRLLETGMLGSLSSLSFWAKCLRLRWRKIFTVSPCAPDVALSSFTASMFHTMFCVPNEIDFNYHPTTCIKIAPYDLSFISETRMAACGASFLSWGGLAHISHTFSRALCVSDMSRSTLRSASTLTWQRSAHRKMTR